MKNLLLAICLLLFAACTPIHFAGSGPASREFSMLGNDYKKKYVAKQFYDLGVSDATKAVYWDLRRMQEPGPNEKLTSDAEEQPVLRRKYVTIPVPAYRDSDGTVRDASNQVVEVVQFVEAVPKGHGKTLFIVQ